MLTSTDSVVGVVVVVLLLLLTVVYVVSKVNSGEPSSFLECECVILTVESLGSDLLKQSAVLNSVQGNRSGRHRHHGCNGFRKKGEIVRKKKNQKQKIWGSVGPCRVR